jgi:hypothetical protein
VKGTKVIPPQVVAEKLFIIVEGTRPKDCRGQTFDGKINLKEKLFKEMKENINKETNSS